MNIDIEKRFVLITGLEAGTSYDVRVRATNVDTGPPETGGAGPYGMGSGTPATLADPATMVVVEDGYRALQVSWVPPTSNGSEITHYMVRYALAAPDSPFLRAERVNAPLNRILLTGLAGDTSYVVQVQPFNGIGPTPVEDDDVFTGTTGGFPSAPRSVTVDTTANGDGTTLDLAWTRVTQSNGGGPIAGYVVEYAVIAPADDAIAFALAQAVTGGWAKVDGIPDDEENGTGVNDFPASATKSQATELTKGLTYLVRVRVQATVQGTSGYALPVKTVGVPVVELDSEGADEDERDITLAPMVELDDTVKSTINVSWNSIPATNETSTITGYMVRWFPSVAGAPGKTDSANISGKTSSKYAITGLTPGTYSVVVSAVNAIGHSVEISADADAADTSGIQNVSVPRPE